MVLRGRPSPAGPQSRSRACGAAPATTSGRSARAARSCIVSRAPRDCGAIEDEMRRVLCKRGQGEDRKSTRLNSSHSQISYAVFCLKKKKNNNKPSNTSTSNEDKDNDNRQR